MTRAHIEVHLTMSLDEATALEQRLAGGEETQAVRALKMALSAQLGLAERHLIQTAAVA